MTTPVRSFRELTPARSSPFTGGRGWLGERDQCRCCPRGCRCWRRGWRRAGGRRGWRRERRRGRRADFLVEQVGEVVAAAFVGGGGGVAGDGGAARECFQASGVAVARQGLSALLRAERAPGRPRQRARRVAGGLPHRCPGRLAELIPEMTVARAWRSWP